MTIGLVTSVLDALATLTECVGAKAEATACRLLLDVVRLGESKRKVSEFLTTATPQKDLPPRWTGIKVRQLLPALKAYQKGLITLSPKAAGALGELIAFLTPLEHAEVSELVEAMRVARGEFEAKKAAPKKKAVPKQNAKAPATVDPAIIAEYASRLRAALGSDSAFLPVFAALKADKAIKAPQMLQVAQLVLPYPPEQRDRKLSLKAIEEYHKSARSFDLKDKASQGRTAA